MPTRPTTHQIADLGISRVSEIFRQAGFACDRNNEDYGEDLIVQPVHRQTVDPFRIYVQVKAEGRKATAGGRKSSFSRTFPRDHVRKWMQSPELVVVAYWFEKSNVVCFAIPGDQYTEWQLSNSTKARIPIVIKIEDVLTRESALRLAWQARIKNIDRMLLQVMTWPHYWPEATKAVRVDQHRELFSIVAHFLEMLGLVERLGAGIRFGPCWGHTFQDFVVSIASKPDKRGTNHKALAIMQKPRELATAIILFRVFQLAPGCGVPALLLGHSVRLMEELIDLRLADGKRGLRRGHAVVRNKMDRSRQRSI